MKHLYYYTLTTIISFFQIINNSDANAQCPVISCPTDITVNNDPSICGAVVNYTAPVGSDPCATGSVTFNHTGSAQTFTVPAGVTSIFIEAYGAQGNNNAMGIQGGQGGFSSGNLAVTPGDVLNIYVGGGGITSVNGGFNGGGNAGNSPCALARGGGGGGASDVRAGGAGLANRVIVAGGGAGAGGSRRQACGRGTGGGGGGGWYGGGGGSGWPFNGNLPTGGTQTLGGNGGTSTWSAASNGFSGGFGFGGNGGTEVNSNQWGSNTAATGANAGGLNGAGGTYSGNWTGASGGGGSSYIGGVTSGVTNGGVNSGNGQVILSWSGVAATTTQIAGLPSGSTFPVGTTTQTFQAVDGFGNTVTCSFDVIVVDNENPVINNCPTNITQSNDPGNCDAVVTWTAPTAADNCNVNTFTSNFSPGDTFPLGTTTVTYTATDDAGNTATCSFDVIVNDTEDPVINNCPSNITQSNDPGNCDAVVTWTTPIAGDNCALNGFTSSHNPGDVFNVGTTTVTYTATDDAGNTTTCSFDVTINDTEDPVISNCPSNITQSNDPGNCDAVVTWTAPTATDNCTLSSLTSNFNSGDAFPVGTTTVIYTATDNAGNTSTCSFDITINETEDPVITNCPANITQNIDPGNCDAAVTWTAPSATDNCVLNSLTSTFNSGDTFPLGTTTVTYTATDDAGNTATCSFDITIIDNENPVVNNCPTNITQSNDPGNCDAVVTWTAPTAADNCNVNTFTSNFNPGDTFPLGTTTVTYTATDDAGNTATCSFDVIVNDTEDPVINNCPSNITQSNDPGNCDAVVNWTAPTAGDNCALNGFTSSHNPGDVFNVGTTTVTYTATDDAGNTTTCTFDVIVNDTEDPVISNCPSNITQSNDPGNCDAVVTWTAPTATDNCTLSSLTSNFNSGDAFPIGTTTVIYTATDNAGNTSTCSFDITINETEDPIIADCPTNITQDNDPGNCDAVVAWTAPTASDNCVLASFTSNFNPGDTFPIGTTTVTYTATDDAGNTATCSFDVIIEDNEDPVLSNIPNDTIKGCINNPIQWDVITASDNCPNVSVSGSHNSGDNFDLGVTEVIYTATDNSGNTSQESFIVFIQDNPDVTMNLNETNTCVGEELQINPSSSQEDLEYEWFFNNDFLGTSANLNINSLTLDNEGLYRVFVYDSIGCFSSDSVFMNIQVCEINISEAMTPNGDGLNDFFIVENVSVFPNTKVTITNRWGNEVYKSENYQNDWDGTSQNNMNFGGDQLPEGTYFYILELGGEPDSENFGQIYKGYFYIKR